MQITPKSTTLLNTASEQTLLTVPVGKSAIVNSVIAAGIVATPIDLTLVKAGGARTALLDNLNIAAASAVDLLPATLNLEAGDSIVCKSDNATFFDNRTLKSVPTGLPNNIIGAISFADNNLFAVVTSSLGLYRSTDGGATWALVYSGDPATTTPTGYVSAFGKLHIYFSATTKIESTDNGATWTSVACTNAPTVARGLANNHPSLHLINVSGTDYLYTANDTHVLRSTDGTTFTNVAAHNVSSITSMIRSGTRFIAMGSGAAAARYSDDNGVTWTASTGGVTYHSNSYGRLANVGNFVVCNGYNGTDAKVSISTNNGATFTDISASLNVSGTIAHYGCIPFSDGVLVTGASTNNSRIVRPTGQNELNVTFPPSVFTNTFYRSTEVFALDNYTIAPFTHPTMTSQRTVSQHLTCNYMEITQ